MDDRVLYDHHRTVMVASLDLCLAGVWHCSPIYSSERKTRRNISCHISSRCSYEFRSVGLPVVYLQSRCHGLVSVWLTIFIELKSTPYPCKHLVRSSSKHRRKLYVGDVTSYVAQRQQHPYVSSYIAFVTYIYIYFFLQLTIFPSPRALQQKTLCVSSYSG